MVVFTKEDKFISEYINEELDERERAAEIRKNSKSVYEEITTFYIVNPGE